MHTGESWGTTGKIAVLRRIFLDHINNTDREARYTPPKLSALLDEVDINMASNYGTCKLCCIKNMQETPIHLFLECPYTWRGRAELFKEYDPTPETFGNWDPASLVKFFTRYNLET